MDCRGSGEPRRVPLAFCQCFPLASKLIKHRRRACRWHLLEACPIGEFSRGMTSKPVSTKALAFAPVAPGEHQGTRHPAPASCPSTPLRASALARATCRIGAKRTARRSVPATFLASGLFQQHQSIELKANLSSPSSSIPSREQPGASLRPPGHFANLYGRLSVGRIDIRSMTGGRECRVLVA
jgi:hypothetical protein